jgi:hypothetical protein
MCLTEGSGKESRAGCWKALGRPFGPHRSMQWYGSVCNDFVSYMIFRFSSDVLNRTFSHLKGIWFPTHYLENIIPKTMTGILQRTNIAKISLY